MTTRTIYRVYGLSDNGIWDPSLAGSDSDFGSEIDAKQCMESMFDDPEWAAAEWRIYRVELDDDRDDVSEIVVSRWDGSNWM